MPEPNAAAFPQLIGLLLGSNEAKLFAAASELTSHVGDGGFTPAGRAVEANDVPLDLFGQKVKLGAAAAGRLTIHPVAAQVPDLFIAGATITAPAGTALADLELGGKLGLGSAVPPLSTGALTLAVTGSAAGEFRYRHLLPVGQNLTRLEALTRLATGTRLPHRVDLDTIVQGEVHRLEAQLNLSFGLEATWGKEFDLKRVIGLWDGLSAEVTSHAAATVQASLGWSLYERMELSVGSANLLEPGRVRIRLRRVSERRFTLGAVVEIAVSYDASSVAMILQQTIDQSPLPRVLTALRPIASGDWDAVKATLTAEAEATLDELLEDTGWRGKLGSSPEVAKLVALAQQLTAAYDQLGERLGSLWDRLLGNANLGETGKIRQGLEALATLAGTSPVGLVQDPKLQANLALFELLAGASLEDLLLASLPELQAKIDEVAGMARRALDFLDQTPATAKETLDGYAAKLGIGRTLDFLRQHATSKEKLLGAVDQFAQKRIRQLVEKLLGKAWDLVSDEDLGKVQRWAERITSDLERLERRLKQALARFKGDLGFSLSVSLDRLSRDEALIDVELDPRDNQLATDVPKALASGSVFKLLEALPDLGDQSDKPGEVERAAPYLLREAVLSHRRVRTNALTTVFHFLGFKSLFKTTSQRVEEARLSIVQAQDGQDHDVFRRSGSYAGGLLRSAKQGSAALESAVWLEHLVDDTTTRPTAPFAEGSIRSSATLSFTYDDHECDAGDRSALDVLLARLGFLNQATSQNNVSRRVAQAKTESRLAITLRLSARGVADLVAAAADEAKWNITYLAAAQRWYKDTVPALADGPILAALAGSADFQREWLRGPVDLTERWATAWRRVEIDGKTKKFRVLIDPQNINHLARWDPQASSLYWLANNRGRGQAGITRYGQLLDAASVTRTQDNLLATTRQAAVALKRAHPGDLLVSWTSPLFLLWLCLAALSPAARREAEGVASFRFKSGNDPDETWEKPALWKLRGGVSALPL